MLGWRLSFLFIVIPLERMRVALNIVGRVALFLTAFVLLVTQGFAYTYRAEIPLPGGGYLPGYCFLPRCGIKAPIPGVIVGVGVGSTKILQYHAYCQDLADQNFFVVLIDPSNYPESLAPGPFSWEKGPGRVVGDINQAIVAGKLAVTSKWYLNSVRGTVDYLCRCPMVDRYKAGADRTLSARQCRPDLCLSGSPDKSDRLELRRLALGYAL